MKKYELTKETIKYGKKTLYRIKALKDFGDVKAGDLGGFVQSEENLSHEGDCWIYNDAKVCDNAVVSDNAIVFGDAVVSGDAVVYGNAVVFGNAKVTNNAIVYDKYINI